MYNKPIRDMEANTGIYDFVYIEQDHIYSYLQSLLISSPTSRRCWPSIPNCSRRISTSASSPPLSRNLKQDDGIYGVPMEAFIKPYLYSADLFADPDIQAAFQEQYGYELAPATNHVTSTATSPSSSRRMARKRPGTVGHYGTGPHGASVCDL